MKVKLQSKKIFSFFAMLIVFVGTFGFALTSPVEAAVQAIGVNGCAVVYNANGSGGLAVRSSPSPSGGMIKRISDGTVVKILQGPTYANGYTWWRHDKGGWSAGSYLRDTTCPTIPSPTRKSVVLDAGHGGGDPGAAANGLKEKDINLDVTTRVKSKLEAAGVTVYLARSGDTNPSLTDRVQVCRTKSPNLLVSIHTNAGGGTGSEGWYTNRYFGSKSQSLAAALSSKVASSTGMTNRGAKNETTNRWGQLGMLSCEKAPSALVELAFIDAPTRYKDLNILKNSRDTLASAVAAAILSQLN
jgi:N-acetylmuramoyl-L-alanine amidase